jgi:NADH:ubiquinone oxidoreductase subunit 6 (subunit J)
MTWLSILFVLHCVVILGAAIAGLLARGGTRTSIGWFLLSMSSLAGVFIMLGAHVIAIAQLLFCAGVGLVCWFAVDDSVDVQIDVDDAESRDRALRDSAPTSWHWLIVTLGIAGASVMWTSLENFIPHKLFRVPQDSLIRGSRSFEAVGYTVLVDHGVALLVVGLLLLGALVGSGYLVRRGTD